MSTPVVSVKQGQLRGKTALNYVGETFYSFHGIPYAKPPVGELRFKAPQPADPWSGILDATKEGPECPGMHMIFFYYVGEEAGCLNLNVYTKELPKETPDLKPVMVYIHGGGFVQGSNKCEFLGPDYLLMEDIVLVTINYRVNALGFLSLEDESLEVPGNAGMKDQVLALKWVQENIRSFNGDPNNVTIFGESAGAASVEYQLLSPLSKGLFHKAIIQSGSSLCYWAYGVKGTEELCHHLGIKEKDEKKILAQLKTLPANKIVAAADKSKDNFIPGERRVYGPVVEKPSPEAFLPDSPENILRSGNYNKVPLIIGYTSEEGILFEAVRKLRPESHLPTDFDMEVPFNIDLVKDKNKRREMGNEVKKFYFGDEAAKEHNFEKTIRLKTDNVFLCAIYRSLDYHQKAGINPVYLYKMTVQTSLNLYKKACMTNWFRSYFLTLILMKKFDGAPKHFFQKLGNCFKTPEIEGVSHADDLSYLFKMFWNPKITPGSVEDIAMRRFIKLWTNFAKYSNPTPTELKEELINVEWKPVDEELTCLEIGRELILRKNPDKERVEFWRNLFTKYAANS